MRERIKQIIEREGMSQSQFADFSGVNRPTLSHVIAGRNNPSIEIMMKIHQKFPKINIHWLFDGTGAYEGETTVDYSPNSLIQDQGADDAPWEKEEESAPSSSSTLLPDEDAPSRFYQGELFAENPIFPSESTESAKKRKEMPLQTTPKTIYHTDTQSEKSVKFMSKKIVEIKIFYDDGTYETFRQ